MFYAAAKHTEHMNSLRRARARVQSGSMQRPAVRARVIRARSTLPARQ